nr:type II toxin-antitoxin system VapC family toxin [uncultured Arsenicibacter sp.]
MVKRYLIDTSAVSKYLDGRFTESGLVFLDAVFSEPPFISVITKIELLSWVTTEADIFHKVEVFVEESVLLSLTPEIIDITINLRRKHKIKTPDALIAATALAHDMILVTDNEKDFLNIKSLSVLSPNSLLP